MAEPKRKDNFIYIRCSTSDKRKIVRAANKDGRSLSTYVLLASLSKAAKK